MLESIIERRCCNWAKSQGISNKKVRHDKGDPDRVFLYQGRVLFVEFKIEGMDARPIQAHRHKELQDQGFLVLVIDNFEVFKSVVKVWLGLENQ
jgi:hypothetical protein